MAYKILAVNPGSTSTKIALYEDEKEIFLEDVGVKAGDENEAPIDKYNRLKESIVEAVKAHGYDMHDIDLFSGRMGGRVSCAMGAYEINDVMLSSFDMTKPVNHPLSYTVPLINDYQKEFGGKAYAINSQSVDELQDVARITGYSGVYRPIAFHALNQKEVGARFAEKVGKKYSDLNLIIAHLGGGSSITAHCKGRCIDSSDGGRGDGPIAPTRSGSVTNTLVIDMCFSGEYTKKEMYKKTAMAGGLMELLGTADVRDVIKMINEGDDYAKLVLDAMIYQICKYIGSMAVTLQGRVDGIIITGGMAHGKYVTDEIRRQVEWIAPVYIEAGEYEMEALSNAALRVEQGKDKALEYTGIPVFDPARIEAMKGKYERN